MYRHLLFAMVSAIALVISTPITYSAECNISPDKRQIIASILCGHAATEPEYRFYGAGCFRKSIEMRMRDSAAQVYAYRRCGDRKFANDLEQALVNTVSFMEPLAICISEDVSIEAVMREGMEYVEQGAKKLRCNAQLQAKLRLRRPAFEAMMEQANDPQLHRVIYAKLGIVVDDDGNVSD